MSNSSFKKVRSISEGNFHSCYASNKAEKFKFRRLSQGLESCAQVQALKLRKEEKELMKLYQNIKREKEKNEYEQKHNIVYLQIQDGGNALPLSHGNGSLASLGSGRPLKLSPQSNTASLKELDQKKDQRQAKHRRLSLPSKSLTNNEEVIPFYMEHGYSHYHYDPHYVDIPLDKENFDNKNSCDSLEQPCWKKDTKLSRLKFRRNAITAINSDKKAFLRNHDDHNNTRKSSIALIQCEKSATVSGDERKQSSVLVAPSYFSSSMSTSRVLPQDSLCTKFPPTADSQVNASVLTPLERQGLGRHQHRNVRPMSPINGLVERHNNNNKNLFEMKKGRRHSLAVTNNPKLNMLKHTLMKRLADGENVKDLAQDEMCDGIISTLDDGRVYPACGPTQTHDDPDREERFQNLCALQKCKYLRISKLNTQSLAEVALDLLMVSDK